MVCDALGDDGAADAGLEASGELVVSFVGVLLGLADGVDGAVFAVGVWLGPVVTRALAAEVRASSAAGWEADADEEEAAGGRGEL